MRCVSKGCPRHATPGPYKGHCDECSERKRTYFKNRYAGDPEYREKNNARSKQWAADNPERAREVARNSLVAAGLHPGGVLMLDARSPGARADDDRKMKRAVTRLLEERKEGGRK